MYNLTNRKLRFFSEAHGPPVGEKMEIPTAKLMFSRLRNSMKIFSILCDTSGSQKSKMAAHKPEILISQPVYNITAKFKKTTHMF